MRVTVIGGGIAGVSIGAELSRHAAVTLVEAEPQLAHHTTGRSAAMFLPGYGNDVIRRLTAASLRSYAERLAGTGVDLLSHRPLLQIAGPGHVDELDATVAATASMRRISPDEALTRAPYLRPEAVAAAAVDDTAAEIDVAALHQSYVSELVANGGVIVRSARVLALDGPTVVTADARYAGDVVVDAAGAWGDEVARLAGVRPVGLRPLRRTIFTSRLRQHLRPGPLVLGTPEAWYFRVDGATVLGSPADETPSEPCDARPEELDVARAVDAVNEVTTLGVRSVESSWAGLRTFAPDRTPVVGCRAGEPWFFWCCGQGGYGIQTAPGLAAFAARLLLEGDDALGLAGLVSPDRF